MSLEKWELTLRLGRIMFGFTFFVTMYAFYMGLLNALGSFGLPAMAPALLNISMLVFTFVPPEWFPGHGDGLAWGVFIGGVLQASLLALVLRSRNFLPRLQRPRWNNEVAEVFKRFLPGVLGLGLLQLSTLVNLYFASGLPEGSISYIYWADRLLEFPLSLIGVSLGSALLPTLSSYAARGEHDLFRETAEESFLMNLFLSLPACLGLYFLAEPIVEVLFFHGRFTQHDLVQTAGVLKIYALSLLVVSCSRVLVPLYYARKHSRFPMILSVVCVLLHVLLAGIFIRQAGLQGLIFASFFAGFINAMMLFIGLLRWDMMLNPVRLWNSFWKMALGGLALVAVLKMQKPLQEFLQGPAWISLFVTIALAVIIYFGLTGLLRSEECLRIRPSFPLLRDRRRQKE
jgi:putative peptidoglycan lipid II flippase